MDHNKYIVVNRNEKHYSPDMLMAFSQVISLLSLHSHPETLGWPHTWVELNIFFFSHFEIFLSS